MMKKPRRFLCSIMLLIFLLTTQVVPAAQAAQPGDPPSGESAQPSAPAGPVVLQAANGHPLPLSLAPKVVTGPQKAAVLRVHFSDYSNTARYSQTQVQGFFDNEVSTLWNKISYGAITISANVSTLFGLPHTRSNYVTDHTDGDLSEGSQYMNVLNDAVAEANDAGYDFTDVKFVMVVMSETDAAEFHRGQANSCMLSIGPEVNFFFIKFRLPRQVGCAIFSENPSENDARVWGRWMHEMGHTFQESGGPAHPSNYNNSFELMDRLYPGHSGMFEKQSGVGGFPGWISPLVYNVMPAGKGGSATIYAEEYQPSELPNGGLRAVRVEVSPSVYYMVSARARMHGDETLPIPDTEGVLIERVVVGANPWVTVIGPGGNTNKLWQQGEAYFNPSDKITISIVSKPDVNTAAWIIRVSTDNVGRPDVMVRQWLSPPLNTYETTDIWVDSGCNGYGSFMYGTYTPSGDTSPVGYGNGDSPCANHLNRVYARVRNIGNLTATNVKVVFQVTSPMGVGMNQSSWVDIGTVTQADPGGAGLASLPINSYTDVYINWTPTVTLTPEQMASGGFNFHTCLRVVIDGVASELNLNNQDGIDEQENISQFFFQPDAVISEQLETYLLQIRNNDLVNPRTFTLTWDTNLPAGWEYILNDNKPTIDLAPGELGEIPVKIRRIGPAVMGEDYSIKVQASFINELKPDLPFEKDPVTGRPDIHLESRQLAGATLGLIVADKTDLRLRADRDANGGVQVHGTLNPTGGGPNREVLIALDIIGSKLEILRSITLPVDSKGNFVAFFQKGDPNLEGALFIDALYQGQADLTQSDRRIFQTGAYQRALIASAYNYLPAVAR